MRGPASLNEEPGPSLNATIFFLTIRDISRVWDTGMNCVHVIKIHCSVGKSINDIMEWNINSTLLTHYITACTDASKSLLIKGCLLFYIFSGFSSVGSDEELTSLSRSGSWQIIFWLLTYDRIYSKVLSLCLPLVSWRWVSAVIPLPGCSLIGSGLDSRLHMWPPVQSLVFQDFLLHRDP